MAMVLIRVALRVALHMLDSKYKGPAGDVKPASVADAPRRVLHLCAALFGANPKHLRW